MNFPDWIGFVLLVPVVLEVVLLFRKPDTSPNRTFPQAQFRIQDLLVAIIFYGVFLVTFKPGAEDHSETIQLLFAGILPTTGFLFSMDVFSRQPRLGEFAPARAFLMLIFLSAFTFLWQISFLGWWFFQCIHGCRRRRSTSPAIRLSLIGILIVYAVAFFLPIDIGISSPFYGFAAYATCWSEVIKKFKFVPDELAGQLWLANPMFWLSLSFAADRRWLMAFVAAAIAFVIGATVAIEPPYTILISPGYLLWVASMATSGGYAAFQFLREKSVQSQPVAAAIH